MIKLISLEEYNYQKQRLYSGIAEQCRTPQPNGIECPECEMELFDSNPRETLASNPPKKKIHCPSCGFSGYRIA